MIDCFNLSALRLRVVVDTSESRTTKLYKHRFPQQLAAQPGCRSDATEGAGMGEAVPASGEQQSTFREPPQYRFAATCDTFADTDRPGTHASTIHNRYKPFVNEIRKYNGKLRHRFNVCKKRIREFPA